LAIAVAASATAISICGIVFLKTRTIYLPAQVVEFIVPSPPGAIFAPPISRQPFAISPDGKRLAFTVAGPKGTTIWVRDLAALELWQVPSSAGAWGLFWSPDSRSIYFSVGSDLKLTNLDTGSTLFAARLPSHASFGSWPRNGDIILYLGPHSFFQLQLRNGNLRKLPDADMSWAQFLPDSDRFLHIVFNPTLGTYQAFVTDLNSHESTALMEVDSRVQYAPPRFPGDAGYLLFVRGGSLLAQPFDANRLRLTGAAFPIVQNIISFFPSASACFSVSTTGVLVYQAEFPLSELRWYDRSGQVVGIAARPAAFSGSVRVSPDDKYVAAAVWTPGKGAADIWTYDWDGKESRRLTYSPEAHYRPVWSPDGSRIAFGSSRKSSPDLTTIAIAEGAREQHLNVSVQARFPGDLQLPTDWSIDGEFIAYDTSLGEDKRQIWLAAAKGGKATPLIQGESAQWGADFSPDGRQIGFVSDQSGQPEVYIQTFEGGPSPRMNGQRHQVSRNGAWIVRWRPDGKELYYLGLDSILYAVPMRGGSVAGEPIPLFRLPGNPYFDAATDFQFDVQANGQRFVMTTAASASPPPFTVIQNWQDRFR
jgi:Tol biopolymer transport system component